MNILSPIADPITGARFAAEGRQNVLIKNAGALAIKNPKQSAEDEELWKAAEGFQQIFLSNMMKQMRSTTFMSDDSLDSSNASQIYISMLDEQITRIASEDRHFGIAGMVHDYLAKNLADTDPKANAGSSTFRHNPETKVVPERNSNKEEKG